MAAVEALVGLRRREAYVDHGGLGLRVEQRLGEVGGVVDRVQDREAVALEELDQAGPEEGVVFGEDKTHGTSRVTTVGPPAGLDTLMVPSNAASRRITPSMPVPASGSAPPRPSSPTIALSTRRRGPA